MPSIPSVPPTPPVPPTPSSSDGSNQQAIALVQQMLTTLEQLETQLQSGSGNATSTFSTLKSQFDTLDQTPITSKYGAAQDALSVISIAIGTLGTTLSAQSAAASECDTIEKHLNSLISLLRTNE